MTWRPKHRTHRRLIRPWWTCSEDIGWTDEQIAALRQTLTGPAQPATLSPNLIALLRGMKEEK